MSRQIPHGVSEEEITAVARKVLLDALEALVAQRDAITLVGGQAIHLRTQSGDLLVASYTTDADLTVDPAVLSADPQLQEAMRGAGFTLGENPGSWLRSEQFGATFETVAVDLMVADTFSGPGSRRSGVIPPHSRDATRKTKGLEPAAIDSDLMAVPSLQPDDERVIEVKVAGPAALLIAKAHKLGERLRTGEPPMQAKDAGDVFRLMGAFDVRDVVGRLRRLLDDERSAGATALGLDYLDQLFGGEGRRGVELAIDALGTAVDPDEIATLAPAYTAQLTDVART